LKHWIPTNFKLLMVFQIVSIFASLAFLAGTFVIEDDIGKAISFGAFFSGTIAVILLFIVHSASKALRQSEERLNHALGVSNDGLWDWNLATGEMFFSPRWCETLGFAPEEVEARAEFWEQRIHPTEASRVMEELNDYLANRDGVFQSENRLRKRSGDYRWNLTRAKIVARDEDGLPARLVGVDVDITDVHDLSEELSYQASHDVLTDLANRREFELRLRRVLSTAQSDNSEHALCYLDLDQFKVINDTSGHVAGDELLRQLGRILRTHVRKRDTLARLGGDEFGVLMEHCTLEHAGRGAEALRKAVGLFRFTWDGREFQVTTSVGVVPISEHSESAASILSAADSACYAAKEDGGDRVHTFREGDADLERRHGEMQWVPRINRALEEDRFELFAQPIVPVNSEKKEGDHYEILLRMRDENGQLVAPGRFLPAAERFNLSTRIDRWVIDAAFRWLSEHPEKLRRLSMCSINLSGLSLGNEEFMGAIVRRLDEGTLPPDAICFEITETAAIANLASATNFIHSLREKGCRFSLDDFGTGLSSFAYLKNLPVDFLKIDGAFVKSISYDAIDLAMVRSINDIGHTMGKQTIAEFVEDELILERLREIGVDYAQGYGIGRPGPIDQMD